MGAETGVDLAEQSRELAYLSVDSGVLRVHSPQKSVSQVAHHLGEAEEEVTFKVVRELDA